MSQPSRPIRPKNPTARKRALDEATEQAKTKKAKLNDVAPSKRLQASQKVKAGPTTSKAKSVSKNNHNSSSRQGPPQYATIEILDVDLDDGGDEEDAEVDGDEVIPEKIHKKQGKLRLEDVDSQEDVDEIKERWTSLIYAFFDPDPKFELDSERKYIAFRCLGRKCGGRQIIRRYLDTTDRASTKNLHTHVGSCWGPEVFRRAQEAETVDEAREKVIEPFRTSGTLVTSFAAKEKGKPTYSNRQLTRTQTKTEIVRWVCESIRPMRIVGDRAFLVLMKTGRPDYYIPSPSTVSRDVKQVFVNARNRVARMLFKSKSRVSLQMDCWTSPNHKAYVGIVASFEDNGEKKTLVLDMVAVPKSHSGKNLADVLKRVVEEFHLIKKVLGVSMDNASVNDVVVDEFASDFDMLWNRLYHVRCFLHVVSLTSKSILAPFDTKKKRGAVIVEGEDDRDDQVDKELLKLAEELMNAKEDWETSRDDDENTDDADAVLEDNVDGWIDETENLDFVQASNLQDGRVPVKKILCKLRTVAFKIIHSTTKLLPLWYAILERRGLSLKLIPRDVATRWNSTFDLADVSYEYREALDEIAKERELRDLELNDEEWQLVGDLRDVLKTLKNATEYFSRQNSDLSHILRSIDRIDDHFNNTVEDTSINAALRSAVLCGKKTLNRYYGKTDDSVTYRIATILNPKFKLAYFKDRKWPSAWIEEAVRLLREEYNHQYASEEELEKNREVEKKVVSTLKEKKKQLHNEFDDVPNFAPAAPSTLSGELDDYLSSPPEVLPAKMTVLAWWNGRQTHYPHLSRMAMDYLVISPSSIDVERLFSRGRLVLSHVRSRLSVQTTRAIMCLGSWSLMGLVHDDDVRKVVEGLDIPDDQVEEDPEEGWDKIDWTMG